MRILLDECLPRKLKPILVAAGHDCKTAREAGFTGITNGELLKKAELLFDVLVTSDRNMRYQQNLTGRNIAVIVLCARSNNIRDIRPLVPSAIGALNKIKPGQLAEIG